MFVSKKVYYWRERVQQRDEVVEAKCNVFLEGEENVFPESLRRKDYQECLFSVSNYVKCFIK